MEGTSMATKFAPPYACLTVGYLEETKLFPEIPRHFCVSSSELIIKWFKRYIDDGFIVWPKKLDINLFISILNNLHSSIQFTIEAGKTFIKDEIQIQELPFLDILVILTNHRNITTDIYYKETNTHYYLDYYSHHPLHVKNNIPYTLAKKIIIFTSNGEQENIRLAELKKWLLRCNYPINVIEKGFKNAKLQGPAPAPVHNNKKIIFSSKYINNYCHNNTIRQINSLLKLPKTRKIEELFGDCTAMIAYKQPFNILRHVTKANFLSTVPPTISNPPVNGLFRCNGIRCALCNYVQECTSFSTYNGYNWEIRCHINCNSVNVLYYLKCVWCNFATTYTGKTNILRLRMNNHISACRLGSSSDKFDNHVYNCRKNHQNKDREPSFHIYAFLTVANIQSLLTYEDYLHKKGFDSMNQPK